MKRVCLFIQRGSGDVRSIEDHGLLCLRVKESEHPLSELGLSAQRSDLITVERRALSEAKPDGERTSRGFGDTIH